MRWIFEVQTQRPQLPKHALPPDELAKRAQLEAESQSIRENLTFWPSNQRKYIFALEDFENKNAELIDQIQKQQIGDLSVGVVPDSPGDREIRAKIDKIRYPSNLNATQRKMLKQVLIDNLRDYQIRNNRYLRQRENPKNGSPADPASAE